MSVPVLSQPTMTRPANGPTVRQRLEKLGLAILVIVICGITFFPIYWMLVTTVQSTKLTLRYPPRLWPQEFSLSAFQEIFEKEPVARWILNSIYLSGMTTAICVVLAIFGGYAISALRWRGRGLFAIFLLMTQMLPEALIIVPIFKIFTDFPIIHQDVRNNLFALALIDAAFILPICVWVMKNMFDTIPVEVREAALVDGAGPIRTLFQIVMPIALPGVVAVGVVAFFYAWNEFLFAQTMIMDKDLKPASVGLAGMITMLDTPVQLLLAAGVLFAIPPVVFYIAMQRYIVAGISAGAVKG
ncbi:MAG: carbohydrate ABC transporter permease [Thermomicrobiales bacterium]|nr:carbohydrate ABC transporter permease [Thermomicrobiales bacterium]MCO5222071.1 carbohydrate ABC transporter permease [Thermomicrobiales bacterium]